MRATLFALPMLALFAPAGAQAAFIQYGDSPVVPPGFQFIQVTESSGTDSLPLYGPPTYVTSGMHFAPLGFVAYAAAGAGDITDGQLNFTLAGKIVGNQIGVINQINISEGGDLNLTGTGTAVTAAASSLGVRLVVTQIDGVDVSPIYLTPGAASVSVSLPASSWWSILTLYNIDHLLTGQGIPYVGGATRIDVVIDNILTALSEPHTAALIAKKYFDIYLETSFTPLVPEPASLALLCLALAGSTITRYGRRQAAGPRSGRAWRGH